MMAKNTSGETGILMYHQRECKMVQLLWTVVWQFLKNVHTKLPYDPAIHFWVYT